MKQALSLDRHVSRANNDPDEERRMYAIPLPRRRSSFVARLPPRDEKRLPREVTACPRILRERGRTTLTLPVRLCVSYIAPLALFYDFARSDHASHLKPASPLAEERFVMGFCALLNKKINTAQLSNEGFTP